MSTTTNWDDFKPIGNSPASSSGVNWGDFTPAPTRTLGGTARDVAVTAVKGAVGLPQAVVGLADIPTGGRVGKALEGAGVRFKDAQDALGEMYSPAQQAANRKVREAEGFVGTAQAMLQNPSTIATGIGESLPQMLGGAGVARGILAAAPRVGAVAAGALGEGVMGAGSAAEQIRGETDDGLLTGKQAALAGASGAATAALGALGGKVAQRLGVGDVDTMLAQGSTRAVGQGSTRSMPRQIIEGGVAEGALEELPQSVAEQALQNVALERPWDEGVGSAAAQGLITGAAMGGAGGGVGASANRAQQRADAQALQRTQAAIDSAEALAQEARSNQPQPLQLGHSAPDRLYVFPDGTTGRTGEVESYLANLPEDQQAEARARLMGQNFTEVNDPQAQQARRWWENYREGEPSPQGPDYLAEVQAAVRSGTPFTTRQTVDTVRDAMEDAWLAQNVTAEPATPAPGAALQAADAMGAQLQGQFQQAGEDAGIAAVDARVRTGRILSGLQNLLDAGANNTARVMVGLNEGLARINEQPLETAETQRVRRMVDAYMGFRGVGEAAPLPADRAPALDPFADNAAMEALIPERPSQRMGIDPAAGPLSKAAATAVDSGAGNVLPGAVSAQENANVQAAPAPLAVAAQSVPAARAPAMEAAGPASGSTTTGVTDGPQADQAQQAAAQPAQAGGAQAAERVPGQAGAQVTAGAPAPGALTDGAPAQDVGAQAAAAPGAQGEAETAAAAVAASRSDGWRKSMLLARPIARELGIDSQGKRLAQVVAEIDAADMRAAGQAEPAAVSVQGEDFQQPADVPAGREVSREIGRYKEGLAEFRANQVRSELARKNPGLIYTVEEDASLKNGFAVVGREPAPGQRLGMERMKAARGRSPEAPKFSRGLRQPTDFVPNADGGLDYGEITPAMGKAMRRQAGTIRLQQGVQNADGSGHGLAHIEARHGKQIRGLGYESVQEFVADVARNIQEVWQAPGIQLLVTTKNGRKDVMYVQLEIAREGDFYRVNSAFPVRQADYEARQKMKRLWPESEPQAKATGQPSAFAVGNAETSSSADPNAITQSKDSVPPKAQDSKFRREGAGGRDMSPELAAAVLKAAQPASGDPRSAARRLSDERLVATQQLVDGLKEKWTNAPEIIVARNMQDSQIPQDVRDYDAKLKSQGSTGEAEGFIVDGKVFLLADKLSTPNDIATVLFHEVLGHWGLRRAFGDTLDPVLRQVAVMRGKDVRAKAREYGLDMTKEGDRLIAAEEVLAEMAQTNPQLTLVQRAISAIRNWLRANVPGFKALRMSNQDIIQAFILPAREAVTRQNETMEQAIDRAVTAVRGDEAPRFSRSAAVTPAAADYTPEQTRAAEHAFGAITKQTWAERAQSFRANVGTKLRQGIVDQFAPIKEVSAKAYMLARLSKGSDGAVEAALLYGKPFLRDGVYDVDMKDGGFAQVLAGLKGEHDRFFQWVAAQRAERLKAEGKENLLTDRDITALKSLNAGRFADGTLRMPAYAAALRDLNAFNEATLKVAMESGLIDQAAYELMKDQPYVPFYRLMEEGDMRGPRFSSGLVNQQAWKKLKGGSQQLNADLLQNTLMNWSHIYAAAARNRASLETMAAADKMGIAYQVPSDTKGAVKVMRDGVAEHWAVEDPYLLDAIMAMSYAPGGLVKAMAPFKRLLTFGVTVNPTFKIRNLIRDSLSAVSQSDLGYNPLANVASGWKATGRDSQTYASMLASGGIIKFGTQENTSRVRAQIERLGGQMLDKQGFEKFTGQMKALWEAYEEFGDRTENVNRAALYERLIAKGHSHAEASFMARDLMDFSMSGKWEAVRFLAQTVPFLNARLQGLYKLGRAAKEDPRRFAAMAGAVSMASLGLMAAYGDDDDWKKREDWDRDAYWWFKIGNTAFRIPKPFELGSIGTLAERTAELMMSEEMTGKRFGARISDMVFNTFAMDPTPQFIKPFIDVYANKDSFSGRAIEGMADERLRPQDRYNERTSEIARLLGSWGLPDPVRLAKGEYSGLSPKQIDFLLRGYFGWLGTVTTTAADMAVRPVLDRGDRPAMRLRDTFLAGNFVESLPTGSSRYVTAMYEQARDVEQAWASYQAAVKSGDMEKAREIQQEEAPKLRNRLAIANAKRQIAELGQQAKRIEGNRLLSAEQKRQQLDEVEARKHQVAQRVAVTG